MRAGGGCNELGADTLKPFIRGLLNNGFLEVPHGAKLLRIVALSPITIRWHFFRCDPGHMLASAARCEKIFYDGPCRFRRQEQTDGRHPLVGYLGYFAQLLRIM